ncbi:MAG: putative glycoside hydrolase [Acidimicrobiales bacterium]|nr:putative glycoside hydrolase [Acidimicrobiales bacterium]
MPRVVIAVVGLLAMLLGSVAPAQADEPIVLSVIVTDAGGTPLAGATVEVDDESAVTDRVGRARIAGANAGTVVVTHPRFTPTVVEWTGAGDRLRIALGAVTLRALHVNGNVPGTARWDELLEVADRTALNAVMLDMKDESGTVWPAWSGTAPAPDGLGRWDLSTIATELEDRGLKLIVRVVAFQDPKFADVAPAAAVHDTAVGGPFRRAGQAFLDPSDDVARRYVRELVVAACQAGVHEVQLDYIRFPDGMSPRLRFDATDPADAEARSDTITSFISELQDEIGDCVLAADIFGFITSVDSDGGIGQQLEAMAAVADVLSPMVYPNHWSSGWFGFSSPAANPGGVVRASMANAVERVGGRTTLRPWLQDFGGYGDAEVRAQIDAADELGLGWMIWNSASTFHTAALPTDAEVRTPDEPPAPVHELLPASGFWDVPKSSTFSGDVAWLGETGITRGCNPPWRDEFCPKRGVTRAEAATFLVRALDLPASSVDHFRDDDGNTHEAAIDALADAGITRGCSATTFCPDQVLTREQMASLLARALGLPRSPTDTFVDDDMSTHRADIERIAAAGITRGCTPDRFCPRDPVTRDQLAAFLHRALA